MTNFTAPKVNYPRYGSRRSITRPYTVEQAPTLEGFFIRLDRMINGDGLGWGKSTSKWQLIRVEYNTPDLTPSGKPFFTAHLSEAYGDRPAYRVGQRDLRTRRVLGWFLQEEGRYSSNMIHLPDEVGASLASDWKLTGKYVKEYTRKGPEAILKILSTTLSRAEWQRGLDAVEAEHGRQSQGRKSAAKTRIADASKKLAEVLVKDAALAGIEVPEAMALWLAGLSEQA